MKVNHQNIESVLKGLMPELKEKYYISRIGYFGSFAKKCESESSDVDILVELEKPLGWEFFDIQFFLESQLERRVDVSTVSAIKEQLKEKILNEAIFV